MPKTQKFDITSRAMLVTLSVRTWSGRKLDKKITAKVAADHGATSDAGRYNKALIAKSALADIAQIVGAARADHAYMTSPWCHSGARIMSVDMHQKYTDTMREHRENFDKAKVEFELNYPDFILDSKTTLNGMWNAADYPSESEIADAFSWSQDIMPIPDQRDFRVDLSADQLAAHKANIEATMNGVVETVISDAWARLFDVVKAMSTKLADYKPASGGKKAKGIFRDSLVTNVRDLADVLPSLNITGDAKLAAMVDKVQKTLTKLDASELRDNPEARADMQKAADDIADSMGAFMGS